MLDQDLFNSSTELENYTASVWRMVETQEAAATLNIVDNMEEQALLEELLDGVKPAYRAGTEGMHYLLKSAFRYPPLKYGSRFGTRVLPGIFYACEAIKTALIETAYYRFIFLDDMQTAYAHEIDSYHSLFSVAVKTTCCLNLASSRFQFIHENITSVTDYSCCHAIGAWATGDAGVEVIRYESARGKDLFNVAITEPAAIRSKRPNAMQTWICRTSSHVISFNSRESRFPYIFPIDYFLRDGVLPRPAA